MHHRRSSGPDLAPNFWPVAPALGGMVAVLALFHGDVAAMARLWATSSAYGHGILIPIVCLYLVWDQRTALAGLRPRPSALGLVAAGWFAIVWLGAYLAGVAEAAQFAVVGMLESALLAGLGIAIVRRLAFPFAYLWLAVPSGDFLLPTLRAWTTGLSAGLLRLSGIPTEVEGTTISVPTGLYYVVDGCAGLNFLLTALALSLLYARFMYRGRGKRVGFVAALLVASVLANGLRVFGIIALAHVTEHRVDIADDHLLFGWVFFAVVLVAAMAVGRTLREEVPEPPRAPAAAATRPAALVVAVLLTVTIAAAAPATAALLRPDRPALAGLTLALPDVVGGWHAVAPGDRQPRTPGADRVLRRAYQGAGGRRVELSVAYYWRQGETRETVGSADRAEADAAWTVMPAGTVIAAVDGAATPVRVIQLADDGGRRRRVWQWFWVGGAFEGDRTEAKLTQVRAELFGGEPRSAAVMLAADEPGPDGGPSAAASLQGFLGEVALLPSLETVGASPHP